jgi:hypothetical protein
MAISWRGGILFFLAGLGISKHCTATEILETIRHDGFYVVDLRNDLYQIVLPNEGQDHFEYGNGTSYVYSIIAPSGQSLFAVKRAFNAPGTLLEDKLVRRTIGRHGAGPEEVVPTPFGNFLQYAISFNENFLVVAGRLKDAPEEKRDAIFLFNRKAGSALSITPYPSRTEDMRSLSVSDQGDRVVYEDHGIVKVVAILKTGSKLLESHPGQFPVLAPEGHAYIYTYGGWLIRKSGKVTHQLLRASNVVGAIRISPDDRFVFFGVDLFGDLSNSQLTVCALDSRACTAGPQYTDWVAGRETFWLSDKSR